MSRRLPGLIALVLAAPAFAAETPDAPDAPRPPVVERALAVQKATATARQLLATGRPAEAAAALEAHLADADGDRAFLGLLRDAYTEELKSLQQSAGPDADRLARVRDRLALLGGTVPVAVAPVTAPAVARAAAPVDPVPETPPAPPPASAGGSPEQPDPSQEAAAAFRQGKYAVAAPLFAAAAALSPLPAEEAAAWAYCRVKLAAERLNAPAVDAATVATLEREVADALALAPGNAKLQEIGRSLLASAKAKRGTAPAVAQVSAPVPAANAAPPAVPAGWAVVETASFRVRHNGTKDVADATAKAAEEKRKALFERWSGPAPGAWEPKCEVVVHATAADYAKATGRPAEGTGHAAVRFAGGRVAERRIDVRADDPAAAADALPRELTHVVVADLFPSTPPPPWAETGMAVLACSPAEVARYNRTLPRCARDGELFAVPALFDLKDYPGAEKITGFYCGSASVVAYLVSLRGELNFTIFLRDCQRYGTASALKKTYGIDGPAALDPFWRQHALPKARAQGP